MGVDKQPSGTSSQMYFPIRALHSSSPSGVQNPPATAQILPIPPGTVQVQSFPYGARP